MSLQKQCERINELYERFFTLVLILKCSIAIHQPDHMPWCGFFNKMHKADVFVILDCVQFSKNNWQNRNRFQNRRREEFWLTVPVKLKNHTKKTFNEIEIANDNARWKNKYLRSLMSNYDVNSSSFFTGIQQIILKNHKKIVDLNIDLIIYFRSLLGIHNKLILSSSLSPTGSKNDLLIDICQKLKAQTYISGAGGKSYLDLHKFKENGIDVIFNQFPKKGSTNSEKTSILDVLLRKGIKETKSYIYEQCI